MKANGKADLYFHAYFLEKYLKSLSVLQDKVGSGASTKTSSKKKNKKAKKSARTDSEQVEEDDGQSGTGLDDDESNNNTPSTIKEGDKIEIFSD